MTTFSKEFKVNLAKFILMMLILINKNLADENYEVLNIIQKSKLEKITLNFSPSQASDDLTKSPQFIKAFQQSIHIFLNNFDEGNQTPLDIYYDTAIINFSILETEDETGEIFHNFLKEKFRVLLNSPKTNLRLIRKGEDNKTDLSLTHFWLFNLKVPQLTDFSFWCAISKSGKEEPLVFGIN